MRFAALLLSAAVFQALLFAAETSTDLPVKLDVGDAHRSFLLHVPPNFDRTKSLPLLILLHGGQGHGKDFAAATHMNDTADKEGFVVAYPDGFWNSQFAAPNTNANPNGQAADYELDDVAFISAMIDTLHASRNIDQNRVYLAGFSAGGFMAYRAAFELSDKIAAVGVVCGAIGIKSVNSVPALATLPEPKGPISLIHIAGKKDQNVLFEGAQRPLIKCLSIPDCIAIFVKADGCKPEPHKSTDLEHAYDRDFYTGGKNGTEVVLYQLENAGHQWPYEGLGLSANDALWTFFSEHPRKREK